MELWLSHSHLNLLGGYLYVGIFLWYPPVPEGPVPLQGQLEAGFPSISLPSSSFIVKLRKKTCVRNGDVMVEDSVSGEHNSRCFGIPAYPAWQQGERDTRHGERNKLEKSEPQAVRARHPTWWERTSTPISRETEGEGSSQWPPIMFAGDGCRV